MYITTSTENPIYLEDISQVYDGTTLVEDYVNVLTLHICPWMTHAYLNFYSEAFEQYKVSDIIGIDLYKGIPVETDIWDTADNQFERYFAYSWNGADKLTLRLYNSSDAYDYYNLLYLYGDSYIEYLYIQ